jgi:hypothetical protein
MAVPARYPLKTIVVQPASSPDGTRFLGLYPPGVDPATNPPLRAFTLEATRVHLKPIAVETVWPGLKEQADHVRELLKVVAHGDVARSREAWTTINRLAQKDPVLMSTLLIAHQSPFSVHKESSLNKIQGWPPLRSIIEERLVQEQARSVPYVAHLVALSVGMPRAQIMASLSHLSDLSFPIPKDPLTQLTRLVTMAPEALEGSLNHLRTSHSPALQALVGDESAPMMIHRLSRIKIERERDAHQDPVGSPFHADDLAV